MNSPTTFYETLLARTISWLFLIVICAIALILPFFRSSRVLTLGVYIAAVFALLCLFKNIFFKRIVVSLEPGRIMLLGLRPGMWKLFQRWIVERIDDKDIVAIKVGYLRERRLGGMLSYPSGEPSKAAIFQMFLWVKYRNGGREKNIYYPHLKNVSRFVDLIACLEARYGSKVEKHL